MAIRAKRDFRLYANALLTSLVVFAVAGSFLSSQYNEMLWHFVGAVDALYLITVRELATATATAPVGRVGGAAGARASVMATTSAERVVRHSGQE